MSKKINFYDKEIINDFILKKIRKIDTFEEKFITYGSIILKKKK